MFKLMKMNELSSLSSSSIGESHCRNFNNETSAAIVTISEPPFSQPAVAATAIVPNRRFLHSYYKYFNRPYKSLIILVLLVLIFLLLSMCFFETSNNYGDLCLKPECIRTASSLLAAIDFSTNPCDDFFQFACGTWNKMHVIPDDRSSISTFEVLGDQLQVILRRLLEKPPDQFDNNSTIKAKLFYKSCLNISQIRLIGDGPLKKIVDNYGRWPSTKESEIRSNRSIESLLQSIYENFNEGIIIEQWIGPDDKNSSMNIIQLDQTQLGLPSRDYFLNGNSPDDLEAYRKYILEMAVLLGASREVANRESHAIVQFEMVLANATLPESDRQDAGSIYKKLTLKQLQTDIPEIKWTQLLNTEVQLTDNEPIVVYGYHYFKKIVLLFQKTDKKTVFNYVIWRMLMRLTAYLIDDYQKQRVEFLNKLLGVSKERSRWIQCVELTNKKFGLAVGALFVRDYFNDDSRKTAHQMIRTLRDAFNDLLRENAWMDNDTKRLAREKANAMNVRIGYPDMITNETQLVAEYEQVEIEEGYFLDNLFRIMRQQTRENAQKLRVPVDRERWSTEPAVVNAFYNPNKNDIVFPAGILQPLFYSKYFPKSLNYGGIGVVIGHEITHGFDDKGRQFDRDGNMLQWWNDATIHAFHNQTQCIIDQYSRYKISNVDLHINGKMTKGENIADNGGLKQSFRAYKKWVQKNGQEPKLPGLNFTHDQLFFLNYAQIWCGTMRPKDIITKIRSSVHCPGPVRVLGPLSNSYEFSRAYKCPLGSPMNPERKCSVW